MNRAATERVLDEWVDRASVAAAMVPLIDGLHRRHIVVTTLHGRRLVGRSVNEILELHRFARHVDGVESSPHEVLPVLHALTRLDLGPSVIDVADCDAGSRRQDALGLDEHLRLVLAEAVGSGPDAAAPRDVVIHDFGHIGRLVARILLARSGGADGLRLRVVVLRSTGPEDLVGRASLLRRDSGG